MNDVRVARFDPALSARVVARTPLFYRAGPDAGEDRSAHVRAGSGIALFDRRLAIIQDDASFVALVDPATRMVESVALPASPAGLRLFDDARGNKSEKLDFEACVTVVEHGGETLLAFGSGSAPNRESVLILPAAIGASPTPSVVHAPALYTLFRSRDDFRGSELNLEGVVFDGDTFHFVQRGNGAPREGRMPVNAFGAVRRDSVMEVLAGRAPAELVFDSVTVFDLGVVAGVPLTFTDATLARGGTISYLASAEDSPDAMKDGPVVGSAVGVIGSRETRYALLCDPGGEPLFDKAEGLALWPDDPRRAYVVIDPDDPTKPCELCDVVLDGPWW